MSDIPAKMLFYYLAMFLILAIACIVGAQFLASYPIWHDVLLVISGLFLAGVASVAVIIKSRSNITDESDDTEI